MASDQLQLHHVAQISILRDKIHESVLLKIIECRHTVRILGDIRRVRCVSTDKLSPTFRVATVYLGTVDYFSWRASVSWLCLCLNDNIMAPMSRKCPAMFVLKLMRLVVGILVSIKSMSPTLTPIILRCSMGYVLRNSRIRRNIRHLLKLINATAAA